MPRPIPGSVKELEEGTLHIDMTMTTPGCPVLAVYHLAEGWFATANLCTHQDCSLIDEGEIEDDEIVCLCHGGAFDIQSGKATRLPCVVPLETFPVRIQDGRIQIDFE